MTPETWEWRLDPTVLALAESAWRVELPQPFCTEVGRRILLAELEFSEWVLRRVEKVQFEDDRSVSRRISVDLYVRDDAPVFVDRRGTPHWLVPLSMMRRRTLVNLDLRDEDGISIPMLGLRLTQKLDQSVLRAAAEVASPEPRGRDQVATADDLIQQLVAGTREQVDEKMKEVEDARFDSANPLHGLVNDPLFSAALARLRRNFTLFVMLPISLGRHRLLRMTFDEPMHWAYQRPELEPEAAGLRYRPGAPVSRLERSSLAAAFNLRPTRVRFQVPAAENAASYHFEITAPHGVRIVRASLLAGRPNEPGRLASTDEVTEHSPIIGLHAVEVPNGSLCRAQVDLRVPTRGWLTTVLVSCWVVVAVLISVWWHLRDPARWSVDQVTNVVLLLVTVSAGTATFIAHREAGGVAARLATRMRGLGAIAIALPAIEAGFLVYGSGLDDGGRTVDLWATRTLTVTSIAIALFILVVWVASYRDETRQGQISPWDFTSHHDDDAAASPPSTAERKPPRNYPLVLREMQHDTPAVGVRSAEGWHEHYDWTDHRQQAGTDALHGLARTAQAAESVDPGRATRCRCGRTCTAARVTRRDTDSPAEGENPIDLTCPANRPADVATRPASG